MNYIREVSDIDWKTLIQIDNTKTTYPVSDSKFLALKFDVRTEDAAGIRTELHANSIILPVKNSLNDYVPLKIGQERLNHRVIFLLKKSVGFHGKNTTIVVK